MVALVVMPRSFYEKSKLPNMWLPTPVKFALRDGSPVKKR